MTTPTWGGVVDGGADEGGGATTATLTDGLIWFAGLVALIGFVVEVAGAIWARVTGLVELVGVEAVWADAGAAPNTSVTVAATAATATLAANPNANRTRVRQRSSGHEQQPVHEHFGSFTGFIVERSTLRL